MSVNRAPTVYAVAAVFLTLAWSTTFLRLYVKGFIVKVFGLEDWFAILAVLLFTLTATFELFGITKSMGMHLAEIPVQNISPAMMYWFSTELAYVLTTGTLKISIILFLLHIATKKTHKFILYGTMAVVLIATASFFLFLVFQCKPVNYFWNQFAGEAGSCLSPTLVGAMTYVHSGVNAFADIVLAILPVVIVSQLQMNIRTKITVSSILSLGLIACVAVIIRIPYVKILVDNAHDFLYSSTSVVIWSTIEPGLAITAANMATLRPLFSAFLSRSKLFGSTTARAKSSGYGYSNSKSGFSSRHGYLRSGSKGEEQFDLRDLGKVGKAGDVGVTTTIQAKEDGYDSEKGVPPFGVNTSQERLQDGVDWPLPEAQPDTETGTSSLPHCIRKTVRMEIRSEVTPPHPSSHERRPSNSHGW